MGDHLGLCVISKHNWVNNYGVFKISCDFFGQHSFFQAAVVWILLYGCITWTLTKRLEKKLDGKYTRMLRAILNKSWRQHPTKHQLYGHFPPITKTIQVRQTRHGGNCWRSSDELIIDVLLWIPTYGRAKTGRPARTNMQQLCEDTGCSPEDLPEAMNDREKWRERVRDIRAGGMTWWWWCVSLNLPILFQSMTVRSILFHVKTIWGQSLETLYPFMFMCFYYPSNIVEGFFKSSMMANLSSLLKS